MSIYLLGMDCLGWGYNL